jgi:LCP family protein required for cell wall assembly
MSASYRAPARGSGRGLIALVVILILLAAAVVVALLFLRGGNSPAPTPTATPIPLDQALLHRRVTFLLLGTDQNATRKAAGETPLTDSMVVMSISPDHKKLTMVSVPRDTVGVPLPNGQVWNNKLNALYEKQGVDTLRDTLAGMLGTKIDYTILVDMDDLVSIVDAFGGVDVTAPEAINDPTVSLRITAGPHHLDGKTALAYSRSRHTTNDFRRAARQQQVLVGLLARFNDPTVKVDVLTLLHGLSALKTDVPDDKIPTLAQIARLSKGATVDSEVLQPPRFYTVGSDPSLGYVLRPNLDAIKAFASPLLTGS